MSAPKTKEFVEILKKLDLAGKKTLIVTSEVDANLVMSSRNVQKTKVVMANNLNTYDIMNANVLVVSEGALGAINEVLKK
jgi:large subunit ribosomal protein L4